MIIRMSCMEGRGGRLSALCLRSPDLLQHTALRESPTTKRHIVSSSSFSKVRYIVIQRVNVPCYVLWRRVTCHE